VLRAFFFLLIRHMNYREYPQLQHSESNSSSSQGMSTSHRCAHRICATSLCFDKALLKASSHSKKGENDCNGSSPGSNDGTCRSLAIALLLEFWFCTAIADLKCSVHCLEHSATPSKLFYSPRGIQHLVICLLKVIAWATVDD
jgi:hypothetical protein